MIQTSYVPLEHPFQIIEYKVDIEEPKKSKDGIRLLKVELVDFAKYGDTEYLTTDGDLGIVVRKDDSILMADEIVLAWKNYQDNKLSYPEPDE